MVMRRTKAATARAIAVTLALSATGCGAPKGSAPDKDVPPPPPTAARTATPSGTAGVQTPALASGRPEEPAAPKEIPLLVPERFKTEKINPDLVYAIDGAVIVVYDRLHLGRVAGETIEPIGGSESLGAVVAGVGGSYPDAVDLYTVDGGGRVVDAKIIPITGKGTFRELGSAGGAARIHGVARVGQSSILSGWAQFTGWTLETIRGPARKIVPQGPAQAGCLPFSIDEKTYWFGNAPSAVVPMAFGATRAGTILSVGSLCRRPGKDELRLAAEIWTGDDPKSRIEELPGKGDIYGYMQALRGKGDEMWFFDPLLHYKDGHFESVDLPGKRKENIAAAPSGELYVNDGETLFRRDEGKWTPVARLDWPRKFETFAVYEGEFWVSVNKQVFRLRPGEGVRARDDCPSPFVYLRDAASDRPWKEKYPDTAAAIASFPEASDVTFVAFDVADRPRIGVSVKSNVQGKALIEHLRPLLPDTSPRLVCFAPDKPRKIAIPADKK